MMAIQKTASLVRRRFFLSALCAFCLPCRPLFATPNTPRVGAPLRMAQTLISMRTNSLPKKT